MARVGRSDVPFGGADSRIFDARHGEVRKRIKQFGGGGQKKSVREKEDEQKLEKARAAAWAWYEHGKGGKESVSSNSTSGTGAAYMPSTVRSPTDEHGQKSSRFKKEALKTSSEFSRTTESSRGRGDSSHGRTGSAWSWDFSNDSEIVVSRASSLFDSYELDSVSKHIDTAFHGPTPTRTTVPPYRRGPIVPHGEGTSQIGPAIGLPQPARPPGASAPFVPQGVTASHGVSPRQDVAARQGITPAVHDSSFLTMSPKTTRTSSYRRKYSCCSCSSVSDVITQEEVSHRLGIDISKCDCQMTPADYQSDGSCMHLHRIMKALQELMRLPEFDYHPQRNHHERHYHHRLHLHHLHRSHENEYSHHLHYQIKLKDGVHHVRRALGRNVGRSLAYWCFI